MTVHNSPGEAPSSKNVLLIGLGTIAATHLKVLERIDLVTTAAGVDIDPPGSLSFRQRELPTYLTLEEAARHHSPDIVVVTTPTPTHAEICMEAAEAFPAAEILVEKPAADNEADATRLFQSIKGDRSLNVAYHMAYSPEVLWAQHLTESEADSLGSPVKATAFFSDPYERDLTAAATRFGNSWIDSGINALSVLSRFGRPVERRTLRNFGSTSYEAQVLCRGSQGDFETLIITTWQVTAPARATRITYASGAELVMEHHAVTGYLLHNGKLLAHFGSDGHVPRRERHYTELYQVYLGQQLPVLDLQLSKQLHHLLLHDLES